MLKARAASTKACDARLATSEFKTGTCGSTILGEGNAVVFKREACCVAVPALRIASLLSVGTSAGGKVDPDAVDVPYVSNPYKFEADGCCGSEVCSGGDLVLDRAGPFISLGDCAGGDCIDGCAEVAVDGCAAACEGAGGVADASFAGPGEPLGEPLGEDLAGPARVGDAALRLVLPLV